MLIVKKFGGTSVANKERIFNVARRCIEDYKKGNDVVVVLSAMGKYTDELITMAKDINDKPPKREMDRRTDVGSTDGHGYGQPGSTVSFPECISGGYAHNKRTQQCPSEKDRCRTYPQRTG